MNPEMLLVFVILAGTIVLFVSDRLRLEVVAVLAMLSLMLTRLLTPAEALAGFSDPIVLIIAGLFVVGSALFQTGVADAVGVRLARLAGGGRIRLLVAIMGVVALLSAFMSNTGATAVLLPVVFSMALSARISPAKLLIPLAFASSVGGMLTLIGTPPNIVVSKQLEALGLAPFGFFDFVPMGVVVLIFLLIYMVAIGQKILPDDLPDGQETAIGGGGDRPSMAELAQAYGIQDAFYRLRVRRHSPLVGRTITHAQLRQRFQVTVLQRQSWPEQATLPTLPRPVNGETVIDVHDILHVQGQEEDVVRMARELQLGIRPPEENGHAKGGRILARELGMVEVLLTPTSQLVGRTLDEVRFEGAYGLTVLSIKRMGHLLAAPLDEVTLRFGDTLLLEGAWEQIGRLRRERRNLVVIGQPQEMAEMLMTTDKAPYALLILALMLISMTFNLLPTVTTVLLAATAVVLTGCLSMEDVYRTMSWESLLLIAAMLPMATALENTGGMAFVANLLTANLGSWGPLSVMAGLILLTTLFSQFISNTATTVLMAPIAVQAALSMGIGPQAFLMAVAVAASAAFSTPIASPVNTLVLGPGGYQFRDFVKVGLPLQLLVMGLSLLVLPWIFPF